MPYDTIPQPYEFFLLAVASFRVWRLLAEDDILDAPRMWLLRLPQDWTEGDPIPDSYRDKAAAFLTCPWCAGFWTSLGFYTAWLWHPEWTLVTAVVFSISAAVGLIRGVLDAPE